MTRTITPQTTLDNLKKEAKRWLKKLRANDAEARERLTRIYPKAPETPVLRDVQHAIALEYGLAGWTDLKKAIEEQSALPETAKYDRLAADMVRVYATGDADAMQRVNQHYGRSATVEDLRATVWRLIYKVRQASGDAKAFGIPEAQELIVRTSGFNNWTALKESVTKGKPPIPPYSIDLKENRISPRRDVSDGEWDTIIAVMKEQGITSLHASGFMTDDVLKRISTLDHVTSLNLGGSRQVSDDGLQLLAYMPQLEHLELSEYPGGKLTDRGLTVLRHLSNLRSFEMTWQRGMTDTGVANLKYCEKLEKVNLMGTPTGDGAIDAMRGKPNLRRFHTGRLVTDTGLSFLRDFPLFRTLTDGEPVHLLIDGPFSNAGMTNLSGLDGLCEIDLFWHVTGITSAAFEVFRRLPNLTFLGCDGELSDDEAMRHIAAIPRLLKLRAQGTVATDDGFIGLSQSRTLERFWGRECPNLTGRGFVALSKMLSLNSLGVSCKKVDDEALSSLPHFPALKQLTPMDVQDSGFRHVGKCPKLEDLSCMYCRETTDVATENIKDLKLTNYYAGLTKITDRSLEILGRISTLEKIELYETKNVTDAGLPHLAGLPNLKEVHLSGLPLVTFSGTTVFPANVRVEYNV